MRVLVVTDVHPPQDARIWFRQCRALLDAGHDITLVAPFSTFGVDHPEARTIDVPRALGRPSVRVRAGLVTTAVMLREAGRHDVVVVHDPELLPGLAAVAALLRLRRTRVPVLVWDDHEDMPAQLAQVTVAPVVRRVGHVVLRAVELAAEKVFRVLLAEHAYQGRFRRRHPVVPNSISVPGTPPGPADVPARVVYLGALTWARGARELLGVVEALPEVRFEVMGNAKDDVHDALRSAAERLPNLVYRGFVPNEEALRRLRGAVAGLSLLHDLPNYAHSQPTKIMEYMAHGVPVVTTPNQASVDLVEGACCGVVVPFGDVPAAVRAIRTLVQDPELRGRMSRAGYAVARRDHDWGADGPRFVRTLEGWLADARDDDREPRP